MVIPVASTQDELARLLGAITPQEPEYEAKDECNDIIQTLSSCSYFSCYPEDCHVVMVTVPSNDDNVSRVIGVITG